MSTGVDETAGSPPARMSLPQRRQQLVEAAIRVMTRDGVRKATTRAVVSEAGLSLSVFHYCFDSKETLLEEVVRTIVGRTASLAQEAIVRGTARAAERSGSPVELVRSGLWAYWEHVRAHPDEHLLTYEVMQHCLRHDEMADVARHQYELYADAIAVQLRAAGLDGAEVQTLARYLAVVVDGLTADWLARRDDDSAAAVLELVVRQLDLLLTAAGAGPQAGDAPS